MLRWIKSPILFCGVLVAALSAAPASAEPKFDLPTQAAAALSTGMTRAIVCAASQAAVGSLDSAIHDVGGTTQRRFSIIPCRAVTIANARLSDLGNRPEVHHISYDRNIVGSM